LNSSGLKERITKKYHLGQFRATKLSVTFQNIVLAIKDGMKNMDQLSICMSPQPPESEGSIKDVCTKSRKIDPLPESPLVRADTP